jgi:hypothetical protein
MTASTTEQATKLGEVEFRNNNDLADYCRKLRTILRRLSQEVAFAADELQAVLGTVPGTRGAMGIDSRLRAKLVAAHLRIAAELLRIAVGSVAKCHASFLKHFAPELEQAITRRKGTPRFQVVEPDRRSRPAQ